MVRTFYLITLLTGLLCLPLALPISLYLGRGEPLVPLVAGGPSLIVLSATWKGLRLDKKAVFLNAGTYFRVSIAILVIGATVDLLTAILGTVLQTGFSRGYTVSIAIGLALLLVGTATVTLGMHFGKEKSLPR